MEKIPNNFLPQGLLNTWSCWNILPHMFYSLVWNILILNPEFNFCLIKCWSSSSLDEQNCQGPEVLRYVPGGTIYYSWMMLQVMAQMPPPTWPGPRRSRARANTDLSSRHDALQLSHSLSAAIRPNLPKQYMLILMNNFLVDVMMYKMLGQSNIQVYQRFGCCLCWWRTSWRLSWCIRCMGKAILRCSAIQMICSGILAPLWLSPSSDPPEL